jgi:hypothetical protein
MNSNVKYFLTHMEFRREMRRSFSGQGLIYSDVDGGDAWRRRKQVGMVLSERDETLASVGETIGALESLLSKAGS